MQFRERRRVIQLIRTTYDPALKRGRSEVVGKIDKAAPVLTDKIVKNCTTEEIAEVRNFLDQRVNRQREAAVRAGAETLPAQIRAAAEYFLQHHDEEAVRYAGEIRDAWDALKSSLRKSGLHKPGAVKHTGRGVPAAVRPIRPASAVGTDELGPDSVPVVAGD